MRNRRWYKYNISSWDLSGEGVRLVDFVLNLESYFDVYEKVVYRPLQNLERSQTLLAELDGFLDQVLGK